MSNGRPGTAVFVDDWAALNAAVVDVTHKGVVIIRPQGMLPQWDEAEGRTVAAPAPAVYQGPATVTPRTRTGRRQIIVGEDDVSVVYDVVLPYAAGVGIEANHEVFISESDDPVMVSKELIVEHVLFGAGRFARHLYARLRD